MTEHRINLLFNSIWLTSCFCVIIYLKSFCVYHLMVNIFLSYIYICIAFTSHYPLRHRLFALRHSCLDGAIKPKNTVPSNSARVSLVLRRCHVPRLSQQQQLLVLLPQCTLAERISHRYSRHTGCLNSSTMVDATSLAEEWHDVRRLREQLALND